MPAPPVGSLQEYDALLAEAVSSGVAFDVRSVYFMARLSPRWPTIETRVADVGLTADETVCYVGLVRALVAMAVGEALRGRPATPVGQAALLEACTTAARVGLAGDLTDPLTGESVPAWELVDRMVAGVRPWLDAHGDEALVVSALDRLRVTGGGAQRQRRLFGAASSPPAFVASLAETTTAALSA